MNRAVIFDIDGTLVDSVDLHAHAWLETLRHFGYEPTFEHVRSQIGKGGDQLLPVFVPKDDLKQRGEEIEQYRKKIYIDKYLPQVHAFPKVRELLARIKADGQRIALASSAKGDELANYTRLADIDDLVETETSSDDADRSKPHPDIFLAALDRLKGTERAAVVVVGDTPYDAMAAGKAGLRTVGVLCGGFPIEDLEHAGCIAIYKDPADLLRRYEGSPLAHPARERVTPLAEFRK
jgi:HAD superfamily hydrolase (TIGR01509 family)